MMNERAAALGCTNTHFVNANGLPDPNHYTSAHDMALIMQECIKNETFCRIESDLTYTIQPTNMTSTPRDLQNHHALLFQDGQWGYKGAFAGKTGYTDEAHNTLVTAAKRGNMTLVCVVLTCDNLDYINDTRTVLDFGYDNFTHYTLKNAKKESLSGVVTLPKNAKIETATYTDPDGASVEEPYTRQYFFDDHFIGTSRGFRSRYCFRQFFGFLRFIRRNRQHRYSNTGRNQENFFSLHTALYSAWPERCRFSDSDHCRDQQREKETETQKQTPQ